MNSVSNPGNSVGLVLDWSSMMTSELRLTSPAACEEGVNRNGLSLLISREFSAPVAAIARATSSTLSAMGWTALRAFAARQA